MANDTHLFSQPTSTMCRSTIWDPGGPHQTLQTPSQPDLRPSQPASQASGFRLGWLSLEPGWLGLRPGWLGLRPGWMAQRGGMDGQMDRQIYIRTDGKSPQFGAQSCTVCESIWPNLKLNLAQLKARSGSTQGSIGPIQVSIWPNSELNLAQF